MEKLSEAKAEYAECWLVGPDEDGVGEEGKEEGEGEAVVVGGFAVGVDEAEEDADVFDEGGADEVRGDDV